MKWDVAHLLYYWNNLKFPLEEDSLWKLMAAKFSHPPEHNRTVGIQQAGGNRIQRKCMHCVVVGYCFMKTVDFYLQVLHF